MGLGTSPVSTMRLREAASVMSGIGTAEIRAYDFRMPNQVIRELYYNYFTDIVEQETGLNRSVAVIEKALIQLARNNDPQPFLNLIKVLLETPSR